MPNPESVRENEAQKLLRDFDIQTDHLFSARWPNLVIINKTNNKQQKPKKKKEKKKKKRELAE